MKHDVSKGLDVDQIYDEYGVKPDLEKIIRATAKIIESWLDGSLFFDEVLAVLNEGEYVEGSSHIVEEAKRILGVDQIELEYAIFSACSEVVDDPDTALLT
jgi:hypothetical protein